MLYVDGYVVPVPTDKKETYRTVAETFAQAFRQHGALSVVECWGDDVPEGKLTSFPMAVKLEPNETVVFSWITWPSKQARDAGMKKVMDDPKLNHEDMPFDGKRMIFGGFQQLVVA